MKRIPPKTMFLSKYLFIQKKFNHIVLSSYSSDNWSTMQDKRKIEISIVIFICFTIPFNEHLMSILLVYETYLFGQSILKIYIYKQQIFQPFQLFRIYLSMFQQTCSTSGITSLTFTLAMTTFYTSI